MAAAVGKWLLAWLATYLADRALRWTVARIERALREWLDERLFATVQPVGA